MGNALGFVKRHKKKFIGTGVLVGGGYVAWKVFQPKLQDYFLKRLLKEMDGGDLLKDLLGELEDPEQASARKRAKYDHTQETSDKHAQKNLDALNDRLKSLSKMDECSQALAKAEKKEDKLRWIGELQVECLARSMSALYVLQVLLLLHRVEFNIVGREMASSDGKKKTQAELDMTAFVVSGSYVSDEGLPHITEVMREAVKSTMAAESLTATTKVTPETFTSFLGKVCTAAQSKLLEGGKGPTTLLPDSLNASVSPKVKQLLDEARDYLESPQFLDVFRSIVAGAVAEFAGTLGEVHEEEKAPPLPAGATAPVAKLGGACVTRSQDMLRTDRRAGFVRRFSEDPLVAKLCEALYFEEAKAS